MTVRIASINVAGSVPAGNIEVYQFISGERRGFLIWHRERAAIPAATIFMMKTMTVMSATSAWMRMKWQGFYLRRGWNAPIIGRTMSTK